MRRLRGWLLRAGGMLGKRWMDPDFDAELASHVEIATEENMRGGMNREEARRSALMQLGGVEAAREGRRDQRGWPFLEQLAKDIRYGARALRHNPGFTLVALLALGLGIGANTALFSVVYSVLLRPLPYADSGHLVVLWQKARANNVENMPFSVQEINDVRSQAHTVDQVEEYHEMYFVLLGKQPDRVDTGVVSAGFFPMLGVKPLLGRVFQPSDDVFGAPPVLVLSYNYWQRAFGGDPHIVGQTFRMNDKIHTVVGVLPQIPQYPRENDVYMPISACPFRTNQMHVQERGMRMMRLFAHLRAGQTIGTANQEMHAVAMRMQHEYPKYYPADIGYDAGADNLTEQLTQKARPMLMLLLAVTGLVLLICCTNVANLALARVMRREHEFAVRSALGASPRRLVQQVLTESTMLALAGGALGLVFASFSLGVLVKFVGLFTTRAGEVQLSLPVLLFTLGLSLATSILFGTLPAITARRGMMSLKEARSTTSKARSHSFRDGLIVAEVALSFVMLTAAGLMIRTLLKLQHVHTGFDSEHVVSMHLPFDWSKYDADPKTRAYEDRILAGVSALPGVTAAALTSAVPLDASKPRDAEIVVDGHESDPSRPKPVVNVMQVSPDAFRTLGIALVRGRGVLTSDREHTPPVVVISQSMAEHYFGDQDPIGHRLAGKGDTGSAEIVGVVADVRQFGLASQVVDTVYAPLAQQPGAGRLVLRTVGDPMNSVSAVRNAVRQIDPEQAIAEVKTLDELRDNSIVQQRVMTALLGIFAALALVIAATGLAGVTAFLVTRRTREIGIRLALGAQVREIMVMVLGQGVRLLMIGAVIGLAASFAAGFALQRLLFEIKPVDVLTLVTVTLVVVAASIAASYMPARRATRVDPMVALRVD